MPDSAAARVGPTGPRGADGKDLAIFGELGFFCTHGAELVPGVRERRSLDESPTYREARQEGEKRLDGYYTCLRITRQRLDSLRRQR